MTRKVRKPAVGERGEEEGCEGRGSCGLFWYERMLAEIAHRCSCAVAAGWTPPELHGLTPQSSEDCAVAAACQCTARDSNWREPIEDVNAPHARLRSPRLHAKFQTAKKPKPLHGGSRIHPHSA